MDPADGWDTDFADATMRQLSVSASALGLSITKMGEACYVLSDGGLNITTYSSIADLQEQITFLQSLQSA